MAYPKDQERRMQQTFIVKYWPLIAVAMTLMGSSMTFYVRTEAMAADVEKLKDTSVSKNIIDLKFKIVENRVDSLDTEYTESEQRTIEQFKKVDEKLDKIYQFMLDQSEPQ